jgi:hypothetical protein
MMRFKTGSPDSRNEQDAALDPALEQALKNFRSSIHAWSEAEFSKPHAVRVLRLTSWRTAAGWALGCVLAAGSIGGGLYDHHRRQELAKIATAEAAKQQKLADEQRARKDDEDLLARVDNDVSRQVPSAMEPLAQLMAEDEVQ